MRVLVTGAAGFIGFYTCKRLLEQGVDVVGLDNINDYYDIGLKYSRLEQLGVEKNDINWYTLASSSCYDKFKFIRCNLEDKGAIMALFDNCRIDVVCNLAAQAGVRYSLENPDAYINSNIVGFLNILEACRHFPIKHLVYASSSSVYGLNSSVPFSEKDGIAHPVSLYAASKKSNELMAHAYSNLYNIPTTGLRFFTVYGPWGRPDMSPFLFSDAILHNRKIKVFNQGDMLRDFTYIDDIVQGVVAVLHKPAQPNKFWNSINAEPDSSLAPYRIYNIGNSTPVKLMDFIHAIEMTIGREAKKEFLPMQLGDVYQTNADTSLLERDFGFKPKISIKEGVKKTINWYKEYYKLEG